MKRLVDNLLHLNNLRKITGFGIFKKAIESKLKLEFLKKPISGNVLVISPHPDDDIFGLGGTLKIHSENKDKIKIVYISDGSGGISNNKTQSKKLLEIRKNEAKQACKILGINDLYFMNLKDGKFTQSFDNTKKIEKIITIFKPNIIYTPSFLDIHPDHVESANILAKALEKNNNFNGEIFSYEIWSPIFINRLINIDKQKNIKIKAIRAHKSQLASRDYENAILSLNQYRAKMFGFGNYAEGFLSTNKKLFLELTNLINNFGENI